MDLKSLYQPAEWQTLQFSVMWVFHSVAGADGVIDKQEQLALKQLTSNASKFSNHLIKEVLESMDSTSGAIFRQSMTDSRGPKKGLLDVTSIINKTLPQEEATSFKKHLIAIGFFIANTSGDKQSSKVSKEEANFIASLAFSLGLKMDDLKTPPSISEIITVLRQ
ncbi:MAG: TerB family tellurite resistance protein [Candidatus Kapaibacteriota bacterium]|jgi:hypothetical protein